jgi:hypothetical protein
VDVARRRLAAQRLIGEPFPSPVEAVRALGAVQAQDYPAARWGIAQRVAGEPRAADVDALYDAGVLIRTHLMRPTWHLVLAEDVRWLLDLTAPRLLRGMSGRLRALELDEPGLGRALRLVEAALSRRGALTRGELGAALEAGGVPAAGQRLPYILGVAQLRGLIVSGPRRGSAATFTLLDARVGAAAPRDRDESLGDLASRYFATRGPATVADFAWWSGVTMADARRAVEIARVPLEGRAGELPGEPSAHLLPNFDEFTVAYRDRSALLEPGVDFRPELFAFGSVLANVLALDGRVAGGWKRSGRRLEVRLLRPLSRAEGERVAAAAERLDRFLGGLGLVLDLP